MYLLHGMDGERDGGTGTRILGGTEAARYPSVPIYSQTPFRHRINSASTSHEKETAFLPSTILNHD